MKERKIFDEIVPCQGHDCRYMKERKIPFMKLCLLPPLNFAAATLRLLVWNII
jgi:hypothetical protein